MTEAKHTPGPWSYENEGQTVYVGNQIEGRWIAQVRGWGWLQKLKNGEEVQDANGRLIAAAPELLEALILMVRTHEEPAETQLQEARELQWIEKARSAIAKATGN